MVVHAINEKMRIRSPHLYDISKGRDLENKLGKLEGVKVTKLDHKSGSLLIEFDVSQMEPEELERKIDSVYSGWTQSSTRQGKNKSANRMGQVTKIGMISTLPAAMVCAATGKKKSHIILGSAFLAFGCVHMAQYSNRLFK